MRLDRQGREIDEHGNLVEMTKISSLSTLKINIGTHESRDSFQQIVVLEPEVEPEPTNDGRFYDPDLNVDQPKLMRPRTPGFRLVQEGSCVKKAEVSRMKAPLGETLAKEKQCLRKQKVKLM